MGRSATKPPQPERFFQLGPLTLKTPLIAASGTVGSVWDTVRTVDFSVYGAAVAKSVSVEPWSGNPTPRLGSIGANMVNHIGIQNPGVDRWRQQMEPFLENKDRYGLAELSVWASVVGKTEEEFGRVAAAVSEAGVEAIEINLSCPNLDGHGVWSDRPEDICAIISLVRDATPLPVGAKFPPHPKFATEWARLGSQNGADWVVFANTLPTKLLEMVGLVPHPGFGAAGYSGPILLDLVSDCVRRVSTEVPEIPIVATGGVGNAKAVLTLLEAGASAVGLGTVHFYAPRRAQKIWKEVRLHSQSNTEDYKTRSIPFEHN